MKIIDLNNVKNISTKFDVIVVGSGPVGLFTSWQLAKKNLRVLILESGGWDSDNNFAPVVCNNQVNKGLTDGRRQGIGGTSTIWGGALIPLLKQDFDAHSLNWHNGWPNPYEEVIKFQNEVGLFFGVNRGNNIENFQGANVPLIKRIVNWPNFNRRNAYKSLKKISKNNLITLYYNAKLVDIISDNKQEYELDISNTSKQHHSVNCKKLFLAAGPIESFRLLSLLLSRHSKFYTSAKKRGFGERYQDHLSAPVAKIKFKDRVSVSSKVGLKFVKGGMINHRYEISSFTQKKFNIPAGFLHLTFDRKNNNAFEKLRNFFQEVQAGKFPSFKTTFELIKETNYLIKLTYHRLIKKELYIDRNSTIYLNLVLEQYPSKNNKLTWKKSSPTTYDDTLVLNWGIKDTDVRYFTRAVSPLLKEYMNLEGADIQEYQLQNKSAIKRHLYSQGEIYHPCGFMALNKDEKKMVVNENLELVGFKNLHILNSALFPSSGGANPTMTLLLLGASIVNKIYKT